MPTLPNLQNPNARAGVSTGPQAAIGVSTSQRPRQCRDIAVPQSRYMVLTTLYNLFEVSCLVVA